MGWTALAWRTQMLLQAATAPLPALDQIGLGGSSYVRGYTLDDGGYDAAAILRNTLFLRRDRQSGGTAPHLLLDAGVGRSFDRAGRRAIGSVGAGADGAIRRGLRWQLGLTVPVNDARWTRAEQPRLFANIAATF